MQAIILIVLLSAISVLGRPHKGRRACRPRSSAGTVQTTSMQAAPPAVETSWTTTWMDSATYVYIPATSISTDAAPAPTSSAPAPAVPASSPSSPADNSSGSSSSSSPPGDDDSTISQYLTPQNAARAQYGASPLTWNNTLASVAQGWADKCVFQHSLGALGPYGENLAAGTGGFTIANGMAAWIDEASQYVASSPVPSHFTQVVWKGTSEVGCAVASCNGIFPSSYGVANYYVCEYYPQGNVIGYFPENVGSAS